MQDNAFTNKLKSIWAFIKRIALKVWAYLKVAKMEWIVLIGLFAFDLISKAIVEATVSYGGTVTIIPYFLNVHRMHNYDAAFGSDFIRSWFGNVGARIFFCVFAVAASVALAILLIKNKGKSKWFRVSLALFIAGAMGNCMDRMFLGYVRDFVEFVYFGQTWFGRKTWYVFNIADAELVIGVVMIVIYLLFLYKDSGKKKDNELLTDELGEIDPVDNTAVASVAAVSSKAQDELSNIEEADKNSEEQPRSEDNNIEPLNAKIDKVNAETPENSVENGAIADDSSAAGKESEEAVSAETDGKKAAERVSDKPETADSVKPKPVRKRTGSGGKTAK